MFGTVTKTGKKLERLRIEISGVVQGVGFRPLVFNAAQRFGIGGFVGNDARGVFIEAEASRHSLDGFLDFIVKAPPPLAFIAEISIKNIPPQEAQSFEIYESADAAGDFTFLSPDIAVCEDCLREFFDRSDRRFEYPFINCTNCGPRFTITKKIPYDRPQTTMRAFAMCAECLCEYRNPLDRRFHAQPNACAKCGPKVFLVDSKQTDRENIESRAAVEKTRELLRSGKIVAVKGIGGFHLACDARNELALQTLRERKGRVDKPFAVMCRDLETAGRIAVISDAERELLTGRERPIVLLKKKSADIGEAVAPNNHFVGVMLPYAPLQHLLFESELDCLVMTSGNFSNEPMVKDNAGALEKLGHLADAFLMHDREIFVQCDDSVVRVLTTGNTWRAEKVLKEKTAGTAVGSQVLPIRRSRGFAPFPVELPFAVPPVLAVGGELKAAFCLARGNFALMSQHIGDMQNLETLRAFEISYEQMKSVFRVTPETIVCDRHPNYLSSNWARKNHEVFGASIFEVQHHEAHIASVMAENGLGKGEKVIGFAFDGTGYGDDGAIWGGEVFVGGYAHFERAAHLEYFPLAGGGASIRNVWRLALTLLRESGVEWTNDFDCVNFGSATERNILSKQLAGHLNSIPTSSFGRLFDAVASIAGVRHRATYEAQAAIEFEALTDESEQDFYEFELSENGTIIKWKNLIRAVADDLEKGAGAAYISAKFHNAVARLILNLSRKMRERYSVNKIALSGGCFQNVALLQKSLNLLSGHDFEVFMHRKVPPNDGGLALGQAVIAAVRHGR